MFNSINKFSNKKYLLKFFYFKNNSIRCTTDVYFQTSVQIISAVSMNILKITPDLTWTATGSTKTITNSISDYPGYSVTSWVSIDSASGQLTINAPSVTSDTMYKFYVYSAVSILNSPIQKTILLTVTSWKVANWQTWSSSSSSAWSVWATNYSLSSGTWVISSSSSSSSYSDSSSETNKQTAKALGLVSASIVGAVSWVVVLSSLMSTSSMTSLWSLVNQAQIF